MAKVAIITDSVASMPPDLIKELNIKVVPMGLIIDGKVYRDQIDIHPDEFWARFDTIKKFSSTAPTPGEFVKIFQEVGQETNRIACAVISRVLSATYQSAVQAREVIKVENPRLNIEVIDSKAFTGAEGFVAMEGARAAQGGKTLSEVVEVMQNIIGRVKSVAGLESLKYLIRSGRAPRTAYIGELLGVKPIVGGLSGSGLVDNLGVCKGKQKCFERLVELVGEYTDTTRPVHLMVHYTNSIEDGKKLLEMVQTKYTCIESYLTNQSPVSGAHTGPINVICFYS
jgi:DegV family protein with EDD domain